MELWYSDKADCDVVRKTAPEHAADSSKWSATSDEQTLRPLEDDDQVRLLDGMSFNTTQFKVFRCLLHTPHNIINLLLLRVAVSASCQEPCCPAHIMFFHCVTVSRYYFMHLMLSK